MSFPKQVFIALISVSVIAGYPLYQFGNGEIFRAVIAGAILATVNALFGYIAIESSFNKSATIFLKVVLGGMGIRMVLLAGIIVLLIRVLGFHILALVGSMGVFYIVYLTLEVLYINRKVSLRQQ